MGQSSSSRHQKKWWFWYALLWIEGYPDGLVQEGRNSIANTLELRLSCTNPSICCCCEWQHILPLDCVMISPNCSWIVRLSVSLYWCVSTRTPLRVRNRLRWLLHWHHSLDSLWMWLLFLLFTLVAKSFHHDVLKHVAMMLVTHNAWLLYCVVL